MTTSTAPSQPTNARAAERAFVRSIAKYPPFVAFAAMLANVVVFIVMCVRGVSAFAPSGQTMYDWGGLLGRSLRREPWRLGTSMFLHAGVLHLAANLTGIWLIAGVSEAVLGSAGLAAVYLFSGLAGGFINAWTQPDVAAVGASGAIMGMYGALITQIRLHPASVPEAVRRRLHVKVGVVAGLTLLPGIATRELALGAHLGGFAAGCAAAWILDRRPERTPRQRAMRCGALFAFAVSIVAMSPLVGPDTPSAVTEVQRSSAAIDDIVKRYNAELARYQSEELTSEGFGEAIQTKIVPALRDEVGRLERFEPENAHAGMFADWVVFTNGYTFGFELLAQGYWMRDNKRVQDGTLRMQTAREVLERANNKRATGK